MPDTRIHRQPSDTSTRHQTPCSSSSSPTSTTPQPSSPKTPTPRYSKRHASFNSPREVPLPPAAESYFDPVDRQDPAMSSASASGSALMDASPAQFTACAHRLRDRFSSASLPPHANIPFYVIPDRKPMQDRNDDTYCPPIDESSSGSDSSTASSSSSFTSAGSTPQPQPHLDEYKPPSPPAPSPFMTRPFSPSLPTAMRRASPALFTPAEDQAPEPPRILENDPSPFESPNRVPAPYEFFLNSRGPPPADSWLEIETLHSEYRLFARLPGFSREGITLATKRRRILHLVADKWGNGGGHFERRISFGHDADLVQVRAEFDGEMLRVTIPRRQNWSSSRMAYSGRA